MPQMLEDARLLAVACHGSIVADLVQVIMAREEVLYVLVHDGIL